MANAFREADTSTYQLGWNIWNETSADKALDYGDALITLRRKSQQLVRDNPIVAGFQQTYMNIISASGPTIYCDSTNRIQFDQSNEILLKWLDNCDMTGTKSIWQIIEEIIAASFVDGDILINLPLDDSRKNIQTVIELIEAYRVQTPSDLYSNQNIRHGVEYDEKGRVKGYWVKKYDKLNLYTSDDSSNYNFFPMYNNGRMVTYLFKAPVNSRPTSSRQYPLITPAISKLKQLDDYYEALIIGARVAACFSAFIVAKNPTATMKTLTTDINGSAQTQSEDGRRYTKLQPGMIFYLQQGEEAQMAAPNRPGDNVDAFILRSCKLLSMCLRLPYIVSFLDTNEVSYSSWRGAILDTNKMIGRWRRDLNRLIEWVSKTILTEASVNNLVRGSIDSINIKSRWPSSGILDMEKESRGNRLSLENKTTSRQMIVDEQGNDYDEIEKELTEEALLEVEREAEILKKKLELEEKLGIVFPENKKEEKSKTDLNQDAASDEAVDRRKDAGNW